MTKKKETKTVKWGDQKLVLENDGGRVWHLDFDDFGELWVSEITSRKFNAELSLEVYLVLGGSISYHDFYTKKQYKTMQGAVNDLRKQVQKEFVLVADFWNNKVLKYTVK